MKKSAISLISYDAEYLPESIKQYYDYVDEIVLGLDKDRITWSRNNFSFDEEKLWKELTALDTNKKIVIIEENFHKHLKPIDNDTSERNTLKDHCTHDIICSFDADEILLNASDFFVKFMPIAEQYVQTNDICMNWAVPYKQIEDKTLVIVNEDNTPFFRENQSVITHKSSTFTYARWTDKSAGGRNRIMSPLVAMHWSISRSEEALALKLANTGHSDNPANETTLSLWKQTTLQNYPQARNFKVSKLGTAQWPKLGAVATENLEKFFLKHIESAY